MLNRPLLAAGAFLFCALPVLLWLALYVPTGESPDEVAHILRTDSVLHGQLVGRRQPREDGVDGGVLANAALLAAGFTFLPGTPVAERGLTRERAAELAALVWERAPSFVAVPNTAVYPPLFYVPGALGMGLARLAGNGPWEAIHWARLANALSYAVVGVAALLLARRLRGLLLATLLLPMSLWLAATCTQDGLVVASMALSVALLTRGTLPAWWGGVACLAAAAMAKPLYLPLALVPVVLAPFRGGAGLRVLGGVAAVLPAVAWYALAQAKAGVPFVRGAPMPAGPFWPGDPADVFDAVVPARQLRVLLAHPSLLLRLPLQLFAAQGDWIVWSMVGLLATFDLLMPGWVYLVWLVAVAALVPGAMMTDRRDPAGPGGWASLAVLCAVVATAFALCDGQYVSWSHTGSAEIEGVQGRYFVPLLGFLGLALPAVRTGRFQALRWLLRLPVAAAGLAGLVVIPGLVVWTYYLR